ncbi:MYCD protein, partial [Crocuta crocuta]
ASTTERSIPTAQMKLKRARLADDLNEKIALRPGPLELVEKNILPVDSAVKEAIKGNQVNFSKSADAFAFEEDSSSDGLSPDQTRGEDPQGSAGSPADTKASETPLAGPLGAIQDHSSSSDNDKNDSASQPSSQSDAGRQGLGALGPSSAGHAAVKSKSLSDSKNRHKKPKDPKPKVKKLKYHQYIPPDQKAEKSPPPMDSAYARLLQQQQLFLQLQILSQQEQHRLSYPGVHPAQLKEPNEQMVRNPNSTSAPLSNTPLSPIKNSFSGQTGVSPLKPGPLPSNLDDLKVEDLKHTALVQLNCAVRQGTEILETKHLRKAGAGGTWVAQLVKHLTSAQVMISQFLSSSPASGSVLTARSLEPVSDSVSPSLSLPLPSWDLSVCISNTFPDAVVAAGPRTTLGTARFLKSFLYKHFYLRGTWLALSVKRQTPDFGSGHNLSVRGFRPRIGPCADGAEPAWDSAAGRRAPGPAPCEASGPPDALPSTFLSPQCSPQHSPLGAVKSPQHISLPPSPNNHYFLPPSSGGAQGEGHRAPSPVGSQVCAAQNSGAHEGHPPSFSPQPSSLHPPFSGTQADSSHGAGGNPCPKSPGVQQKVAGLHSSDKTGPKFSIPSPPFSKSTSAVPEITQPPSYEDAVKQQMTRSQQMDELLDVLIESGEMPADAREDHSCLQKVPKLPGSSRSPNAALPKPSSSGQLSFDHYGTDSDEHLEVLLNSQSPLGKAGDVALLKLGSEEPPFDGIMDGFSGKPAEDLFSAHEILPGPLSPMQTQFSPSSADSSGLRLSFTESPWETMEWLDLTPPSSTPSFSSLGPSGPSIFNIDFLDVTDLNLNSPMDLHLQQW